MLMPSAVIRLPQKKHPFSRGPLPCRGGSVNLCGDHQYVGPTCGALPTVDPFVSTAANQATSRATAIIEKPGLETFLGPLLFIRKTLVTMVLITYRPTKRLHQVVAGGLPHLHEVVLNPWDCMRTLSTNRCSSWLAGIRHAVLGIDRAVIWVASLPPSYLENELVGPFFEPTPCGKPGFVPSPVVVPEASLAMAPEDPRVGLLAFYGGSTDAPIATGPPILAPAVGSMMPPIVGPSVNCAGQGTEHGGPSPCNSPLSSTPASPYESPPTSGSNSRATSPWTGTAVTRMHWDGAPASVEELLHRAHLKKYYHMFKNFTLDDVLAMNEESMKAKGLPASCSRRLLKEIASLKSHTNGLLSSRAVNAGTAAAFSHASGESSTTSCSSECSSPSPPPALRAVRAQSPASSGSDDSTQPSPGSSYGPGVTKWPAACEVTEATAASVIPPEAARLGSQPPSVMPLRYPPPPGSVLVEPQHRFLLLTDRPTYGPSRAPVRPLAPVVKTATDGVSHSNPAVTTSATFGPMYSVGIMPAGVFPQHSFPPFLHAGHQSNGYLSFLSGAGYVAPPTTAAAYVPLATFGGPSVVVPPPPTSAKVASCYNCGMVGHRGHECKEATVEEATKARKYTAGSSCAVLCSQCHFFFLCSPVPTALCTCWSTS
ncbi:hypothetical protein HPB51_019976 [Rhipicephalus microplus]|uniref:CCHC-type domain-containing protein n=1 Tax=Rhipicephalus microplus TaxID=6941 RepID=A0A9J6DBL5_RHIMP|nr:hypothetical protein HPB51_019976 [Rhipicephalus microplus]